MSSIKGLPTRGSDVTVLITRSHLHPQCVLVEFWGKFCQERTADYEYLAKDIQSPGNSFQEFEGNPGDQCLVQIDGIWYRSRIVSRSGLKCSVFLIDKGRTCNTTTSKLAWGKKQHFHLPPEVEFCVLANVLPLTPENRWSPVALEFLKSLSGRSVKAHVQDVLVPHRTFLLHIPCISKQMYEMGIAKKLSPDAFQGFVLKSLQPHSGALVSPEAQISMGAVEQLHKKELYMYPELPAGTVETVIVTEVTNPQRIFCQLKVFSQELKKLSGQLTQRCEGRMANCIVGQDVIGFPCAARGSDGRWYRSVLQQVFPNNNVVEVLNVDYGTKQIVPVENVRPLALEFFRMPVVTYICSLHGIIDKGVGWTTSQVEYLRTLLLQKTVIAKFEYQSISEGVHYVTLYGDENTNINNMFGTKESCFLEGEKTLGDYAICRTAGSRQHPGRQERNQRKMFSSGQDEDGKDEKGMAEKLPAEVLALNSSHVAVVPHVSDPSEFWIQTQNYANELDELMDSIYHLYSDSVNKDVVRNPTVGLYCAAKAEDSEFYRATVAELGEQQVKVFFVDYGNTEVVDRGNIRTLPDELKKLPCLSLKCSLAGVRPKDGRWSPDACDFFIKAVTDKELTVHVTAKHDEGYVVQLKDPKAQGERDLSTLMCSSGFAERAEIQRQPKANMTTQPAILPQLPDARLSGVCRNKAVSFQTPFTVGSASNERLTAFKEHMFPIGSVLDVSVSYIESPNDFWCQLVQNAGHLKLLMHDIQAHYAGSEFQPFVETACVARHPDNGMWYRALVIHKHETADVDVLFVDYGQTETVSLFDLRRISPQFLNLRGQAFRCSLLNPVDPTCAINEWSEEAVARFQNFVETAASNFVILKCTIYAVMYSEQKIVFNIVDLETPFESVCTTMANLVKSVPPSMAAGPSFRLDTYYYSTHNIKTGKEEPVTVTCVNTVSQFYCQLERNADVMKDLKKKVNNLCHQLENVKLPTVFATLCFAKYTDGQWYRGQIKATKPAILVHFVDYGDTIQVEKSDLLPVPREAKDIMSVPVQAVVCSLSDFPADVPSEVNAWFETSVTECKFRALVVAREPDGKLLVELYHGNTQVNSKMKKMFQIKMHTEANVVHQGRRAEASTNHAQKTPKVVPKQAAETEDHTQISKKNVSAPKPARHVRDAKVKSAPLELYIPPHQRQSCKSTPGNTGNGSEPGGTQIKPRKKCPPIDTEQLIKSTSPGTESQKESNAEKFPKLADLPSKSIASDMEADIYVSHCNSPLSFYVQLVREEDGIFSLVEKLNDPQFISQTNDIKDLHPGDLVQAEFADDSSWYRAVVREIHGETMALVEFVDFGNTAKVPISKIDRLHKSFLELPVYSTHCMLSEAAGLGKEEVPDPEVVSAFKKDIGSNGEKVLKCHFISQSGSVWEVSLEDSGVNVMCKVPTRRSTDASDIASEKLQQVEEKPAQNSDIRKLSENSEKPPLNSYHQQVFIEGQKLEVYITAINDAQTFWCQSADSEELDKITSGVSEVGSAVDHKHIDPGSVSPGSPCVALFSDDQFWYRAEVIDKNGDELSVLFVDYGNKSQVNITDVREMPPDLMETTPQAFLCELEGFDASHGSWDSGAVDELSGLTTDKVLQLTVTRVTREEGRIKCLVWMECEGQGINEAMKTWWKSSTMENEPGAVGLTTLKETAPPEDQPEYPESQEMDNTDTYIHPQRDPSEEQSTGELVDPQADILPCDGGIDPSLEKKGGKGSLTLTYVKKAGETDEGTEEEGSSVDTIGLDDLNPPLEENPTEAIDESETATTVFKSLDENLTEATDELEIAIAAFKSLDENPKEAVDQSVIVSLVYEFVDENHVKATDESEIVTIDSESPDENPTEATDKSEIARTVLESLYENTVETVNESVIVPLGYESLHENPTEATDESEMAMTASESQDENLTEATDESETVTTHSETLNENPAEATDETVTTHSETLDENPAEATDESETVATHSETLNENPTEATDESETVTTHSETLNENPMEATDESETVTTHSETLDENPTEATDESETVATHSETLNENPAEATDESETVATDFEALDENPAEATDESETVATHSETLDENPAEVTDESETVMTHSETLDENPAEATDESEIATVALESLSENPMEAIDEVEILITDSSLIEEVNNNRMESSYDIMNFSDSAEERDNSEVTTAVEIPPTSTTTVKMVPREAFSLRESEDLLETQESISEDLKQTELVRPCCVPPVLDVPTKCEMGAGDDVPKEELPCVITHVESDLMTAEESSAHHEDTDSALRADADTAASESQICTASSQDSGDGVEEVTCCVEEACLTDICTDPNEPGDDVTVSSEREESLSSMTAEDIQALWLQLRIQSVTEDETSALHQDPPTALPSDTEPQVHSVPCQHLSDLDEEVTCLVGPTDVSRETDDESEAETEDSEQLLNTATSQEEDFSDGVLEDKMSSAADSFEAQLSQRTHLSLIINEDSADPRLAERQPEE
ncbi:tudor domain-containing 6 isoform X2 [Epinephelus moara]|uniref:tudor domain-containing 6 isoform X2 n=1 Tax=Epinephelus moara TaxID=300413 RepID=UPI00214F0D99|nr:tudor domain-containing 6 isoform X2 [Epinephelus moara]